MSRTEKVLSYLQEVTKGTVDLLDAMLSDYPTSYRKLRRGLFRSAPQFKTDWALWYRERQHYYTTLYRLKKDGLVAGEKQRGVRNARWRITAKGLVKLKRLRARKTNPLVFPPDQRGHVRASLLVLVIFDVPEREKQKRQWLRTGLVQFGFELLQKSVWIGKQALPEAFIRALREHKILPYVHILTIGKTGTIRHLTE